MIVLTWKGEPRAVKCEKTGKTWPIDRHHLYWGGTKMLVWR